MVYSVLYVKTPIFIGPPSRRMMILSGCLHLRFRLFQPVRHPPLPVHRRRGCYMLLRLLARARALIELAEAEVAVGDKGAHARRVGQLERVSVVAGSVLGAAGRRDVTGQAEGVGLACARPEPAGERQGFADVAGGL